MRLIDIQEKGKPLPRSSVIEGIPAVVLVPCVSSDNSPPRLVCPTAVDYTHGRIRFRPHSVRGERMGTCWRLYCYICSYLPDNRHLLGEGANMCFCDFVLRLTMVLHARYLTLLFVIEVRWWGISIARLFDCLLHPDVRLVVVWRAHTCIQLLLVASAHND